MPTAPAQHAEWVRGTVVAHQVRLLRYARHLTGSPDQARDLVRDVFLNLCRQERDRLAPQLALWLFAACRRRALALPRRAGAPLAGLAPHPCRFDALPAQEQEVLRLKCQEDFSCRQIARIVGGNEEDVLQLLHGAVHKLLPPDTVAVAPRITAYALGELTLAAKAELERTRAADPRFATEVAAVRTALTTLAAEFTTESPPPALPPEARALIETELAAACAALAAAARPRPLAVAEQWACSVRTIVLWLLPALLFAGLVLGFVAPLFAAIFAEMLPGERLPYLTERMLAIGLFVHRYWLRLLPVLLVCLLLPTVLRAVIRHSGGTVGTGRRPLFSRPAWIIILVSAVILGVLTALPLIAPLEKLTLCMCEDAKGTFVLWGTLLLWIGATAASFLLLQAQARRADRTCPAAARRPPLLRPARPILVLGLLFALLLLGIVTLSMFMPLVRTVGPQGKATGGGYAVPTPEPPRFTVLQPAPGIVGGIGTGAFLSVAVSPVSQLMLASRPVGAPALPAAAGLLLPAAARTGRIADVVNAFRYDYRLPEGNAPVAVHAELTTCPWAAGHLLLRLGLQAREFPLHAFTSSVQWPAVAVEDVEVQIMFTPLQAEAYRVIGAAEAAAPSDAGTAGGGLAWYGQVTALYEIVPTEIDATNLLAAPGMANPQSLLSPDALFDRLTLVSVQVRGKAQGEAESRTLARLVVPAFAPPFAEASADTRFAAAAALFGMLRRGDPLPPELTYERVAEIAEGSLGANPSAARAAFPAAVRCAATPPAAAPAAHTALPPGFFLPADDPPPTH